MQQGVLCEKARMIVGRRLEWSIVSLQYVEQVRKGVACRVEKEEETPGYRHRSYKGRLWF